jgi:hypothetical protein
VIEPRKTGKRKAYDWVLIIAGTLLLAWTIYRIVGEFTFITYPEPLRSALSSGEAEIVRDPFTPIWMSLSYLVEFAIGVGILYTGINKFNDK